MEKVTVNDVRKIAVGKSRTFRLPTPRSVKNAQVLALADARMEGYKVKTTANYDNATLTIERIS